MSLDGFSDKEKRIIKSSILIGGALGTFVFYKTFGLFELLDFRSGRKKTLREIIGELSVDINARCLFYDDMPSVIDEKKNSLELSRLYYYGFPYEFKRPAPVAARPSGPTTTAAPDPQLDPRIAAFVSSAVNAARDAVNQSAETKSESENTVLSVIVKKAIDINSDLAMMIPDEDFKNFMEEIYYKYKSVIISSYENGIKLRIPHQPLLSCLPLVVKLFEQHGYYFSETATLYRMIAYQKTLLRIYTTDAQGNPIGDVIINGINIRTGKTVTEEPPPPNAVVIPTSGPAAGRVIPVSETAIF
jgi:hypothetical protein